MLKKESDNIKGFLKWPLLFLLFIQHPHHTAKLKIINNSPLHGEVFPENDRLQDPEASALPSPCARCIHSSQASRPKCDVTGEPLLKQTGI